MTWLTIFVTSPDTHSERRFASDLSTGGLKLKLEPITGIAVADQKLSLLADAESGRVVAELGAADEGRTLEQCGVRDWMCIRVTDTRPGASNVGQFTDVSQVEKYEMEDEAYAKRRDTVMAFKQRNKLGRFGDAASHRSSPDPSALAVDPSIVPGARCQVDLGAFKRRGTIRFVGPTSFGPADEMPWVGVEYDEPVGKNDGSVEGKRYFECNPRFGGFVRPDKVTVGDFGEEDLMDGLDEDEEM